jgi:hypothetical protein
VIVIGLTCLVALASQAPGTAGPRRIDVKAIEWQVPTEPVVLGVTERVPVTLAATKVDGTPLDVAAPVLWASTGALSTPERTGPGQWKATYTPPPERFPHVAILSAQVETTVGPAVGFISLPLHGKGRLEVKTKRSSSVVVYLGNESYGPVKASDQGVAAVDIVAPPGPERAVAESTDIAGNQSSKPVPLGVPSFSRLALMPIDDVAAADGSGEAQLLLFIVDKKGAPLFDATDVSAEADIGGFKGDPLGLAPGVFRLRYQPGETQAEQATITVKLAGSEASTASAAVKLLSGRPVRAEVALSTDRLTADDSGVVEVTTRWFDAADNPSPASAARISVDVGRLDPPTPLEREGRQWRWHLPKNLPATEAKLTARATTGEVLAEATVALEAGAIAKLELLPIESLVADGKTAVDVAVRASDQVGNPLSPDGVTFSSPAGQIVGATLIEGTLVARFVPEPIERGTVAEVTASLGELSETAEVQLRPPPRPMMSLMLGARADWNAGSYFGLGGEMSALLRVPGLLNETLHVGMNLGIAPSLPLPVANPHDALLVRFHVAFPVLAEVAWRPLVYENLTLHVGGGVGGVMSDLTLFNLGASNHPQRSVTFAVGGQAAVGLAYRLGPGELEGIARVGAFLPLGGRALWTPTATTLTLGYRFNL